MEQRQLDPGVIEKGHGQHAVMRLLAKRDELVFERSAVASIKPVEKFGFKIGYIHLDGTQRGARFTR